MLKQFIAAVLLGVIALGSFTNLRAADSDAKPAADAAAKDDGFKPLFDGKSLDGWEGDPALWSVKDGTIIGQTSADAPIKHNTFLIYKKAEVGDFELRFSYRMHGGNSGVQYRSKVIDEKEHIVGGYQADADAGNTYTGIVYDEAGGAGGRGIMCERGTKTTYDKKGEKKVERVNDDAMLKGKIKNEEWNDYVVIAKGNHLLHQINGQVMSETIDDGPKALKEGVLALQLHAGPPMKVEFKDVRIRMQKAE